MTVERDNYEQLEHFEHFDSCSIEFRVKQVHLETILLLEELNELIRGDG